MTVFDVASSLSDTSCRTALLEPLENEGDREAFARCVVHWRCLSAWITVDFWENIAVSADGGRALALAESAALGRRVRREDPYGLEQRRLRQRHVDWSNQAEPVGF